MAISEDLQRRIQNLTGDMGIVGGGALSTAQMAKGAISNRDMELFEQASPENLSGALGIVGGGVLPAMGNMAKGAMSNRDMELFEQASPSTAGEQQEIINQIEAEEGPLTDEEKQEVLQQIEGMSQQAQAPLAAEALELQQLGEGPDTILAHLEPGDVIIPPDLIEDDPEFESYLEQKFNEYDINPESRVAQQGIGTLDSGMPINPMTGLPQYGFLKKIGKKLKKVIRPLAKIAQFIPGPIGAVASIANKALTVYDVAKGKASPLALLSVAGPMRTGPSIRDSIGAIKGASTSGSFFGGLGQTLKSIPSAAKSGIGSLIKDPRGTIGGLFQSQNPEDYVQDSGGNWVNKITGEGLPFGATDPSQLMARSGSGIQRLTKGLQGTLFGTEGLAGGLTAVPQPTVDQIGASDRMAQVRIDRLRASGMSDADIMADLQASGYATVGGGGFTDQAGNVYTQQQMADAGLINPTTGQLVQQATGQFAPVAQNVAQAAGPLAQAATGPFGGTILPKIAGALGLSGSGTGGGGIGSLLGLAGAGALAGQLGKLAYEETKNMRGVPITPMTAMGPTGRFNIEAEVNRRMGLAPPDPIEFGLLPEGTIPELSGGKPIEEPIPARYGGAVMAYANGGDVALADFERMNGQINGEGTETSDDIPAMLSDGEFVMTGQSVRGAGAYELAKDDGGILTLIPSLDEDRERGTDLMYSMMEEFGSHAHA